jgi:tRNA-dihydrouridine synthase B
MLNDSQIRNIKIKNGLVLAPMSGVTCMSFRRLVKELNGDSVGLMISEFISVEGMTRHAKKTLEMMRFKEAERPFGIQIFGYDIDRMATAAKMCQDAGVDLVDINCGCPAPKVVKKGGGCELMRQPDHLAKIFAATRKAVSVPLTMKMRSGWDSESTNCDQIAKIAQEEGLEAVTIHGRTRVQLYRGCADWQFPARVKTQVKIPVFGSGDVVDADSATEKLSTGVDGLYIGRAAISNPLVFKEIATKQSGTIRNDPKLMIKILKRYSELLAEEFPEKAIIGKLKQLASQMVKGQEWRKPLLLTHETKQFIEILDNADRN